jgi:hypothetical protein
VGIVLSFWAAKREIRERERKRERERERERIFECERGRERRVRFLKSLFDLLLCGGYARWVWVLSSGEV